MAKNKPQSLETKYRDFSRDQLLNHIEDLEAEIKDLQNKISNMQDEIDDLNNLYIESHEQ